MVWGLQYIPLQLSIIGHADNSLTAMQFLPRIPRITLSKSYVLKLSLTEWPRKLNKNALLDTGFGSDENRSSQRQKLCCGKAVFIAKLGFRVMAINPLA